MASGTEETLEAISREHDRTAASPSSQLRTSVQKKSLLQLLAIPWGARGQTPLSTGGLA